MTSRFSLPTLEEPLEIKKMGLEVANKSSRFENLRIFNKLFSYLWREWRTTPLERGIDDKTFKKFFRPSGMKLASG